ncbi:MAG: hypothetical protein HY094_06310 [Candidatus Melainabacteria bacterium]|nr:hypothetical protein [Candidatus Melainabacteria bacterium]
MHFKQITITSLLSILFINHALAFSNCQLKYDNDKRSLPSRHGDCSVCHISPNGGGPTNEFGKAFQQAGFKITDELVTKFPNLFKKPIDGVLPPGAEQTPKPQIKRVKPKSVKVNVESMVSIMGKNFISGAKAFIDDNEVMTTFKSNVKLVIDFILDSVGVHKLKVQNPDGQESNTVNVKAK